MRTSQNKIPREQWCPLLKTNVASNQTIGQCIMEHDCYSDEKCPLEDKFEMSKNITISTVECCSSCNNNCKNSF